MGAITVIVEVLQIDGLALGRAIVTSSVLASVCIFFVRQNGEELRRLLFNQATLEYVQQDQAISDAVLREKKQWSQQRGIGGLVSGKMRVPNFVGQQIAGLRTHTS